MAGDGVWKAYRYDPSLPAAAIFSVLFFLLTFLHLYQLLRTRTWVFIPFVLGGFFEAVGYIGRIMSATETPDWSLGPYITQSLLLLVAPALFAASIYMILGRIILVTDGETHSMIRQKWLTKVFVIGDVVSFLAQGSGGGLMAGRSANSYNLGKWVITAGLVMQIIFFSFFVFTASTFHRRMLAQPTAKVASAHLPIPWRKHLSVLYTASILILVRSVFRLVEYTQGNDGYIMQHEWFLYVFDSILMFGVMVIFAWIHPSEIYALLRMMRNVDAGKTSHAPKLVRKGVQFYTLEEKEQSQV